VGLEVLGLVEEVFGSVTNLTGVEAGEVFIRDKVKAFVGVCFLNMVFEGCYGGISALALGSMGPRNKGAFYL
jgi:hypothetical protein